MVHQLRNHASGPARIVGSVVGVWLSTLCAASALLARAESPHFQHAGTMPPGAIGSRQLARGGPLPGYFQPVEIIAPQGAMISTASEAAFDEPQANPVKLGLLIGQVYRLRVTDIPLAPGIEVFPTIEVIDRLYPPVGQEHRFPIPLELTAEELEMAAAGKMVTRVIYLENPRNALPQSLASQSQSYFEAAAGEDPLVTADRLGRPVAILRMGARLPDAAGPDEKFLFGSPALLKFRKPARDRRSTATAGAANGSSMVARRTAARGKTSR